MAVRLFLISHSLIKLGTKQSTLECLAVTQYPWKIVCISEKALQHIASESVLALDQR